MRVKHVFKTVFLKRRRAIEKEDGSGKVCVCGFCLAAGRVGKDFPLITRGDHRYLGKESLKVVGS